MRKTVKPDAVQAKPRGLEAKANNELLFKGVFLALVGLAVLISPGFIASPEMRATIAGASLVGWFALILGAAFLAQGMVRRWKSR